MTTQQIRIYKTNRADDPGELYGVDDIARLFWESERGKAFDFNKHGGLEPVACSWVAINLGGWDEDDTLWPAMFEAIFEARPWAGQFG